MKIQKVLFTGKAINLIYNQFNLPEYSPSFAKEKVLNIKSWMTDIYTTDSCKKYFLPFSVLLCIKKKNGAELRPYRSVF